MRQCELKFNETDRVQSNAAEFYIDSERTKRNRQKRGRRERERVVCDSIPWDGAVKREETGKDRFPCL